MHINYGNQFLLQLLCSEQQDFASDCLDAQSSCFVEWTEWTEWTEGSLSQHGFAEPHWEVCSGHSAVLLGFSPH